MAVVGRWLTWGGRGVMTPVFWEGWECNDTCFLGCIKTPVFLGGTLLFLKNAYFSI